jgi:hypothetical protein
VICDFLGPGALWRQVVDEWIRGGGLEPLRPLGDAQAHHRRP